MPVSLLRLFHQRASSFNSLRQALMLLTEGAENGLTQAGALLSRIDTSLPEYILWVNPEVPAELAPTVDRDHRMYAVALKECEQKKVMALHPWLDEKNQITYELYLDQLDAYGLSHVMDVWRSKQREVAHYFVIETLPGASSEPGGIWKDLFQAGQLVWICRREGAYIVQHKATGDEKLEEVFGINGKTFWLENWLTSYWAQKIGYYVGVEACEECDPRVWAALSPGAPRSALSAFQYICNIVKDTTFKRVISRIPECHDSRREYRLYRRDNLWFVVFERAEIEYPLKRGAAWPYIQYLFQNPGIAYAGYELGELRPRSAKSAQPATFEVSGIEAKARMPKAETSLKALGKLDLLRKYINLKDENETGGVEFSQAVDRRSQEIESICETHPDFQKGPNEDEDDWSNRLIRMLENLKKTAIPDHRTHYDMHKNERDRVNRAIEREIKLLKKDFHKLEQYLCRVLKYAHGKWTYSGREKWESSPPVTESPGKGTT